VEDFFLTSCNLSPPAQSNLQKEDFMNKSEDITLIAPCGSYCGSCPVYKVKDDPSVRESLIKGGVWNGTPCPGCRPGKGKNQFVEGTCPTYACVTGRGLSFCFECAEFPCARLNPASHRAEVLPHNLKIFNLSLIKKQGVTKFLEKEPESKALYFRGKMVIGRGPKIE
jgi:hypothetical protein